MKTILDGPLLEYTVPYVSSRVQVDMQVWRKNREHAIENMMAMLHPITCHRYYLDGTEVGYKEFMEAFVEAMR
jgi:hypothetical protein